MNIVKRMWLIPTFSGLVFLLFLLGMLLIIWYSNSASNQLVNITKVYQPILKHLALVQNEVNSLTEKLEEAVITDEVDLIEEAEENKILIENATKELLILDNSRAVLLQHLLDDYIPSVFEMTIQMMSKSSAESTPLIKRTVDHRNELFEYFDTYEKKIEVQLKNTVVNTRNEIQNSTITVTISFLFVSLFLSIGSIVIVRNTSSKLQNLMNFAQEVEKGNYNFKIDSNTQNEFSSLVNALNSMAGSIKQSTDQLNHMAHYDSLTAVPNRRAIMDRLNSEVKSVNRHKYDLSFCMCDIDKFKYVNDTYGHQVGDFVINTFAQILKQQVREEDIVGRYGGDEFCIILPHTKSNDGSIVLERVRKKLEQYQFQGENNEDFTVTGSFGIAQLEDGDEINTIVKKADEALYQSKEGGRNSVTKYQ